MDYKDFVASFSRVACVLYVSLKEYYARHPEYEWTNKNA